MADTDSDLSSASDSGGLTLAEFLQTIRLDPGVPILEYVQRLNGAGFFTPKDIFIDTADNIVKECKLPPADVRRIWANAERLQREGKVWLLVADLAVDCVKAVVTSDVLCFNQRPASMQPLV